MSQSKALRMMLRVSNSLLKHDKDMPLTRLQVLAVIALNDGCVVRDVMQRTGLAQSTIARTVAFLGEKPIRGAKEGLNWVVARPDPADPRRVTLHLTNKGKQVAAELEALVD